jgi:GalNAc-alpha-(1->4)-GalNAc-alpha-(1->3)-diNAcBac-PP-undecaprenol alpha-1,4-N-acetyl-D-galactosaminyltransferase
MSKPAVILVISDLGMGGSQGVISRLANALVAQGYPVSLLALDSSRQPPFYPLAEAVHVTRLGVAGDSRGIVAAVKNNISRLISLRRAFRAQRAQGNTSLISFGDRTNVLVLLASRGLGIPVVISERTTPWLSPLSLTWKLLRRLSYPTAHAMVVLNERCAAFFQPWLGGKVSVIPNPVEMNSHGEAPSRRSLEILGLGRLAPIKGFDLLIRAFAQARETLPEWRLVIHGEGPARAALQRLIEDLSLGESVSLPGATGTSGDALRRASIFVMPSRVEAFPNALCEAMASGCAVIAFDCETGPREILTDGVDGLLIPNGDVASLASALRRLARDPAERAALGARAALIAHTYSPAAFITQWSRLLEAR